MFPDAETHAGGGQTHSVLLCRLEQSFQPPSACGPCLPIYPSFCPSILSSVIYPFIHPIVCFCINIWLGRRAWKTRSASRFTRFLVSERQKKPDAQTCRTVKEADRANKHPRLQTHPHAGTASVLTTFSTSVLHHLVFMSQRRRRCETPSPVLRCDL